jgi:hypothetical protein
MFKVSIVGGRVKLEGRNFVLICANTTLQGIEGPTNGEYFLNSALGMSTEQKIVTIHVLNWLRMIGKNRKAV